MENGTVPHTQWTTQNGIGCASTHNKMLPHLRRTVRGLLQCMERWSVSVLFYRCKCISCSKILDIVLIHRYLQTLWPHDSCLCKIIEHMEDLILIGTLERGSLLSDITCWNTYMWSAVIMLHHLFCLPQHKKISITLHLAWTAWPLKWEQFIILKHK